MSKNDKKIGINDVLEIKKRQTAHLQRCPTCNKENCNNIWHIAKLLTRSTYELRPRHFFAINIIVMLIALLVLFLYVLINN